MLAYADETAGWDAAEIPDLLFVAEASAAARRMLAVAAELGAADRAVARLPLLATTVAAIRGDPDGPLGPVWHRSAPGTAVDEALRWPGIRGAG